MGVLLGHADGRVSNELLRPDGRHAFLLNTGAEGFPERVWRELSILLDCQWIVIDPGPINGPRDQPHSLTPRPGPTDVDLGTFPTGERTAGLRVH